MISIKPGVIIFGLQPEMLLGISIIASIFAEQKEDLVITSVMDGKHMAGSRHYAGQAVDIRLVSVSEAFLPAKLKAALGPDFDVVPESDHLHIEYDKRGMRFGGGEEREGKNV
jgi:hypothetical protein